MASGGSGNVRVFIRWDDQTVFAGEEIKCTITFKNVAPDASQQRTPTRLADRKPFQRAKPTTGLTPPTTISAAGPSRGHRHTLSLSAPAAFSRSRSGSSQWPQLPPHPPKVSDNHGNSHRRSISIVSVGSASATADETQSNAGTVRPQRPGRGHGRASSLQISPRAGLGIHGPHSGEHRAVDSGLNELLTRLQRLLANSVPPTSTPLNRLTASPACLVLPRHRTPPLLVDRPGRSGLLPA